MSISKLPSGRGECEAVEGRQGGDRMTPPFAIGADVWPGTAKLMEELGELQQVLGKLLAYPDSPHPDGSNLVARLGEEIADVQAALEFFKAVNDLPEGIESRMRVKLYRFNEWHDAETAHATVHDTPEDGGTA